MRASRRLGLAAVLVAGCFNPSGGGSTSASSASSATTGDGSTTAIAPTTGPGVPTTGVLITTGEPGTTGDSTGAPLSSSSETTAQSTSGSTSETSGTSETTALADTGTTAPDETTSGTTGLALTCGDGVLQEDEECDDSNQLAGDGCNASCDREVLLIFASSAIVQGVFGGVDFADNTCRGLAAAVQVPPIKGRRIENFVAYLSAPGVDASSRIKNGDLGYVRPKDLAIVAKTHGDLLAGNFLIPVKYDELGVQPPGDSGCGNTPALVWTGTIPGGMTAPDHCDNWMNPALIGQQGSALSSGPPAIAACGASCAATGRFYCVENP